MSDRVTLLRTKAGRPLPIARAEAEAATPDAAVGRKHLARARRAQWAVLAALLSSCARVHEEPRWIGLTEAQLVGELGPPTSTAVLSLTHGVRLREEQSSLEPWVPATDGPPVAVRELRWKHLTHTSAAWLVERSPGEWRVVQTLVWRADVRF